MLAKNIHPFQWNASDNYADDLKRNRSLYLFGPASNEHRFLNLLSNEQLFYIKVELEAQLVAFENMFLGPPTRVNANWINGHGEKSTL